MKSISINITTPYVPPPSGIHPSVKGRLFWARHDWQSKYYNYKTRIDGSSAKGTPQVLRFLDSNNETMPCWYQHMWFDSLCYFAPGRSHAENVSAWEDHTSSIKAFNNEWGTDRGKCCITGRNPTKELAKQANVSCGGNIFIGIPGKTKSFKSGLGQAVLVLDKDYEITWVELLANPLWRYFMHTATVITKYVPTKYPVQKPSSVIIPSNVPYVPSKVNPFPHNQFTPTQITPVPMGSYISDEKEVVNGIHCRIKYVMVDRLVYLPDEEYNTSPFVE